MAQETVKEALFPWNDNSGLHIRRLKILGAVPAIELYEEVVLDPQELAKCSNRLVLCIAVQIERLDTSDQDGLHVAEQRIDVNQVNVDLALLGWCVGVNAGDVLEILDHPLVIRVLEQASKVATEHILAELDLLGVLCQLCRIDDDSAGWSEALMALGHDLPSDIKLLQLCVDCVDDSWDERLDKVSSTLDGSNIVLAKVHELGDILEAVDGILVQLGAIDVLHVESRCERRCESVGGSSRKVRQWQCDGEEGRQEWKKRTGYLSKMVSSKCARQPCLFARKQSLGRT